MDCLRCKSQSKKLGKYKFESQDGDRGLFGMMFDVEKHLIFDVYVCQYCGHSELIYQGSKTKYD